MKVQQEASAKFYLNPKDVIKPKKDLWGFRGRVI